VIGYDGSPVAVKVVVAAGFKIVREHVTSDLLYSLVLSVR